VQAESRIFPTRYAWEGDVAPGPSLQDRAITEAEI